MLVKWHRDRLNMILFYLTDPFRIDRYVVFLLILRINKLVVRIVILSHSVLNTFICTFISNNFIILQNRKRQKISRKNSNVKYTQFHSLASFINLNLYLHLIKNAWRQGIFHIYFMFNTIMNCYVFSIWRWIQVRDTRKKYEEEKDDRKNSISNFYHVSFKQPSFRSITFLPSFFFFFFSIFHFRSNAFLSNMKNNKIKKWWSRRYEI